MPTASIKKIIPCNKNYLVTLILDIEKYPEFVPWCIKGTINDKNESEDLITFNGDLNKEQLQWVALKVKLKD